MAPALYTICPGPRLRHFAIHVIHTAKHIDVQISSPPRFPESAAPQKCKYPKRRKLLQNGAPGAPVDFLGKSWGLPCLRLELMIYDSEFLIFRTGQTHGRSAYLSGAVQPTDAPSAMLTHMFASRMRKRGRSAPLRDLRGQRALAPRGQRTRRGRPIWRPAGLRRCCRRMSVLSLFAHVAGRAYTLLGHVPGWRTRCEDRLAARRGKRKWSKIA